MKVFISWSGDLSNNIAETLRQWMPKVIQAVKPYYSPDDISKGTRWSSEIANELDASKVGLICLTKDNLEKPWIMFEAGALSKNIEKSKVVPLLFDIEPSDIKGPLVQFQATRFSKNEVKKMMKMINAELKENTLETKVFDSVFDTFWPELESDIKNHIKNSSNQNNKEARSQTDMIQEILSLTRKLSIKNNNNIPTFYMIDMLNIIEGLIKQVRDNEYYNLIYQLQELYESIEAAINIEMVNGKIDFKLIEATQNNIRMMLNEIHKMVPLKVSL